MQLQHVTLHSILAMECSLLRAAISLGISLSGIIIRGPSLNAVSG